ncbi:MAG: hypothetical protein AB1791_22015 [Chloroflexota bacterium]
MSGLTVPIILTTLAIILAFASYRGVRRGGARFYTLEREAILRRASFTLAGSTILFLAVIGLLVYQQQLAGAAAGSGPATDGELTATPTTFLQTQPPTPSPSPTVDLSIPTVTPTPVICRAVVDGTGGAGLMLREEPAGAEITILPDGTIVSVLPDEPISDGEFTWRRIRTVSRDEGWVVEEFLTLGDCGQ